MHLQHYWGIFMSIPKSALFDGISETEYAAMLHCFETYEQSYFSGALIRTFDDRNRSVGILQSGRADILRLDADGGNTVLEQLEEGSIFGEMLAFSGAEQENICVVCTQSCQVLYIDYEHIIKRCPKACAHHSTLVQNMLMLLSQKALLLSQRVEILSCRSIREKLLHYFSLCAHQQGSASFRLPFSMSALADYICADRSAMTREMSRLKREQIISVDGRKITLLEAMP